MLSSSSELEKLIEAVKFIRQQFQDELVNLLGGSVSIWSESDSWIIVAIAEKRVLRQNRAYAEGKNLTVPLVDPLNGERNSRQEWEAIVSQRLGWEARFRSWNFDTHSDTFKLNADRLLDWLDRTGPGYAIIKKTLQRPYREPSAYFSASNPVAYMQENFSSDEFQTLGVLIRENLGSTCSDSAQ